MHFPAGLDFPAVADCATSRRPTWTTLPDAGVAAFSIDDETTTEIDDCLSLQQVANGLYRIGVHIAAPALGYPAPRTRSTRRRASG